MPFPYSFQATTPTVTPSEKDAILRSAADALGPMLRETAAQALEHEWITGGAPSAAAPPENFDVQLADRLKTQMEFIQQVREEEMLAAKQAHRVDGTTKATAPADEIFSFPKNA